MYAILAKWNESHTGSKYTIHYVLNFDSNSCWDTINTMGDPSKVECHRLIPTKDLPECAATLDVKLIGYTDDKHYEDEFKRLWDSLETTCYPFLPNTKDENN